MRKRKNRLSKLILVLGLFILTTNCTDNDETVKVSEQKSDIIIKQLNYQELSSDEKVIEKLYKIEQFKKTSLSSKSTEYIADYDFYIDLETIKTVELENYKTYNFLIQRENPQDDKLENLFLRLNNVGEYDAYILKYDFSATEFENLTIADLNNRRTEYTPIDIAFSPTTNTSEKYICTETWDTVEFISPRDFGSDENNIIVTFMVSTECVWFNEGAGIPIGENNFENDPTDDTNSSGGTGAVGNTSGSNNVYSTPVYESPEDQMLNNFFDNLNDEQNNCLNSQPNLRSEIKGFLLDDFDENFLSSIDQSIDQSITAQNIAELVLDNCGSHVDWVNKLFPILHGYPKCVYEKLDSLNLFKETIGKFHKNPRFHLIIKNGVCKNQFASGCTDGTVAVKNGFIIINIANWDSDLDLAQTILHEGIHAEIYRFVYQFDETVDPNDKPKLMELYNKYGSFWDSDGNTNTLQHEYMAEHYVTPMAEAIRQLDNNSYPLEYYMGFGWFGLENTGFTKNLLTDEKYKKYKEYLDIVTTNTNFKNVCDE